MWLARRKPRQIINILLLVLVMVLPDLAFVSASPIEPAPTELNSATSVLRRRKAGKRSGNRKRSGSRSGRRSRRAKGRRGPVIEAVNTSEEISQIVAESKPELPKPKRGKFDVQLNLNSEDGIFWDSVVSVTLIPQFDRYPGFDSVSVRLTCRSDSSKSRVHWDTSATIEVGDEVTFKFKPREPGFYWLQAELYAERKLLAFQLKKAGFQPQWFFPALAPPPDLNQFWQKALAELEVLPTEVQLKPGPRHRWPSMEVYSVSIPSTDGVQLHGWLTIPKAAGAHPVILELPPYGNSMKPDLTTRDLAVLRLDVRGHGRSRKPINPGFPGFMTYGLPEPTTYIYKGVVQDCMAALRFLKSNNRIDQNRIGVMGVSQGGGLASMVAFLDSNVKAMAVSVPFMCNWPRYFEVAPWPKRDFAKWLAANPDADMAQVLNTLSYFDPVNLATGCRAKIYLAVGLQDMTCPPDGAFAWFNTMTQNKQVDVFKDGQHILPGVRTKMMNFLRKELKGY